RGYNPGILGVGPVADNVMRTCDRHIKDRQAARRKSVTLKVEGDQSRLQPCSAATQIGIHLINGSNHPCRGIIGCKRRAKPLYSTALLVNKYGCVRTPDTFP